MIGTLLQQPGAGTFSPEIVLALGLVVLASSLALGVTVGLSKRIKAIGDAGASSGERRSPDEDEDDR